MLSMVFHWQQVLWPISFLLILRAWKSSRMLLLLLSMVLVVPMVLFLSPPRRLRLVVFLLIMMDHTLGQTSILLPIIWMQVSCSTISAMLLSQVVPTMVLTAQLLIQTATVLSLVWVVSHGPTALSVLHMLTMPMVLWSFVMQQRQKRLWDMLIRYLFIMQVACLTRIGVSSLHVQPSPTTTRFLFLQVLISQSFIWASVIWIRKFLLRTKTMSVSQSILMVKSSLSSS